jgi:hypothetical protein
LSHFVPFFHFFCLNFFLLFLTTSKQKKRDQKHSGMSSSSVSQSQLDEPASRAYESFQATGQFTFENAHDASRSHTQTELLELLLAPFPSHGLKQLIDLKVPLWLYNHGRDCVFVQLLDGIVSRLPAAAGFQERMPLYMLLHRRVELIGFCQMAGERRFANFLLQDFEHDDHARTTALKTGYILESKWQFELSMAYFLLGGHTKECVAMLMQRNQDVLALLVCLVQPRWDRMLARKVVDKLVARYGVTWLETRYSL